MHEPVADGRYTIIEALGAGGTARVYKARDWLLDRDVALKIMKDTVEGSGGDGSGGHVSAEHFRREARSTAAISHQHVVRVYDVGQVEDGLPYIAMEYVPGGTLRERLAREGRVSPVEAIGITLQIAQALCAAHERDIIHRDVKPSNVLITRRGDVKLADFGIARNPAGRALQGRVYPQTERPVIERDRRSGGGNAVAGTVSYISPEQASGERPGPESDLYSLGVVLYEMLTGQTPFGGASRGEIASAHINVPPRPPSEVCPDLPEGLEALAMSLLEKDPDQRPGDAGKLADTLESLRAGLEPEHAPAPGHITTRNTTRNARSHPAAYSGRWTGAASGLSGAGHDTPPRKPGNSLLGGPLVSGLYSRFSRRGFSHGSGLSGSHAWIPWRRRGIWRTMRGFTATVFVAVVLLLAADTVTSRYVVGGGTFGDGSSDAGAASESANPRPEAFVHEANPENISGNSTYLDDAALNGDPAAIISVTQNWNPGGGNGTYNESSVGVWYDADRERWAIFNQDRAEMPGGASFNVVSQPS